MTASALLRGFLWPPYGIGQPTIFLPCSLVCSFFLLPFFVAYSQRSEIGCLPYFHTWCARIVRILNAGLKCAAGGSPKIQDAKKSPKNSPSGHHNDTNLSCCILASKTCIDNRKNHLSINISSTCSHNMANFGPLTAKIGLGVCGTTANFNEFSSLCSSSRRQPNFTAWYKEWNYRTFASGATYIWQGSHHVGHRPTI